MNQETHAPSVHMNAFVGAQHAVPQFEEFCK